MKKALFKTIVIILVIFGGLTTTHTTANASKVHSGVPKVLKNTKWKSKTFHLYGKRIGTLHFEKKSFLLVPAVHIGVAGTYNVKYKYLGNRIFYLVGRAYENQPAGGVKVKYKVKYFNSHKIYLKQLNIFHDKYTKYANTFFYR